MCMGMGKTGIPWDSHRNGNKVSHGMGMGSKCMGIGIKTWEWEKLRTVNSKHLQSVKWVASGMSCRSTWTLRSAKTQILFSFGWIISRSCQSCIQWLAKSYVCRHLQLPVREYLVLLGVFWRSAEQTCHQELWTVFCSCIATWSKDTGQYCGWWWCCSGAASDWFLCLWAV